MRGAFLLVAIAFVTTSHADDAELTTGKQVFSNMCYRRKPVVSYVTRSNAWKEGRRDILDWGCGSGALSLALAENGANKVVAIDLNGEAVNVARRRLKPFPNASSRRPQFGSRFFGLSGKIAYHNQFDVVLSYMGALTDGTTQQKKIATKTAMDCAVEACRDDGSVIVAELSKLGPLIALPTLVIAPLLFASNKFLQSLNWWQLSLASVVSSLICGINDGLFLFFAARSVGQSIAMKKLRMRSMIWSGCLLHSFVTSLQSWYGLWKQISDRKAVMESAGLSDIKVTTRLCFRVAEVLEATDLSRAAAIIYNTLCIPGMVVIYEGSKANIKP